MEIAIQLKQFLNWFGGLGHILPYLFKISALYKSFTYLLTYLLSHVSDVTTAVSLACCLCDYVAVPCSASHVFKCPKTDRCIRASYVCDGHNTCGDWSDEVNCRESFLFI